MGTGRACFGVVIEEGVLGAGNAYLTVPDRKGCRASCALDAIEEGLGRGTGALVCCWVIGLSGWTSIALQIDTVPSVGRAACYALIVGVEIGCR